MKTEYRIAPLNILMITLGTALYAFGFVNFNMANHLAEGGVSGITLLLHHLWGLSPAITSFLINIPLLIMGWRYFGRKALILTVYGTITLSIFIAVFETTPFHINLNEDLLIASLLAGLFAGLGLGLVFRFGGTTGGTDIISRIVEKKTGNPIGQTLLIFDIVILLLSLTYIDLRHMMYTVIAAFVYSQLINLVEDGGYISKGMLIITKAPLELADAILKELNRGVTYLHGQGAYSQKDIKVLYVVLSPQEVFAVKEILHQLDPEAFFSVLNVREVTGEGFTWNIENGKKLPFTKKR